MNKNTAIKPTNKLRTRLVLYLVLIQVLFGIGIIILLKMDTRNRIDQLEDQIVHDKKESLRITTKLVYKTIDRLYQQSFDPRYIAHEYKRQLSSVVDSTISLLDERYQKLVQNPRNTDKDIKEDLIRIVKSIRYQKGAGYLWIHNRSNIMLAHSVQPSLEGRDLNNLKDANGKLYFRLLTKQAQRRDGGFVDYYWPKPGREKPQLKLSYVKRFQPYNWIVGTEINVEDVLKNKISDMKELVSIFRYSLGNEKQNYFWINDLNHKMVVHPFSPDLVDKNVSNIKDSNGKFVFREFVTIANKKGEGYADYYWPRPGETVAKPKLSFVKLFKPLGWVIGTGVYMDDIISYVAAEEKNINRLFYRYVILILIATIISIGITIFAVKNITNPLEKVVKVMGKLAQGDLSQRVNVKSQNEIGRMSREIDKFVEILTQITRRISLTTNRVTENSSEISVAMEEQSAISAMQSKSVIKITSTVEELSASSKQIAEHSNTVLDIAEEGLEKAELGVESINKSAKEMEDIINDGDKKIEDIVELGKKSQEINTVMEIINNIADQTKLIAFNAALEASSAGEAGKRFGVVAVEIRRLADNVMESTSDIANKIHEIQESINQLIMSSEKTSTEMHEGKNALSETKEILKLILEGAKSNAAASKQISISTRMQETGSEHVVNALKEISEGSKQNSKAITQTIDITKVLLEESEKLKKVISLFDQDTSSKPSAKSTQGT